MGVTSQHSISSWSRLSTQHFLTKSLRNGHFEMSRKWMRPYRRQISSNPNREGPGGAKRGNLLGTQQPSEGAPCR